MLVQVTKEHLLMGKRNNTERCPVALACLAMGYAWVSVGTYDLGLAKDAKGRQMVQYRLPMEVTGKILSIDRGQRVEPFSFILEEGGPP
jgi:hypothetical protein